jgi:hypothetical protein
VFSTKRIRLTIAVVAVAIAAAGTGIASTASASPAKPGTAASAQLAAKPHEPKLTVTPFSMSGYVINAKYTLGRNTGNTFQQVYGSGTVQGTPIAGPYVGTTFPAEDYVALPISHDQVYITWLDPTTFAIVDVFVMNLRTHTVYDYAPGSASPQSAGTIAIVKKGAPLP